MKDVRRPAALLLACAALGCSTVVTPDTFDAEAPLLKSPWPGPVAVLALAQERPHPRFNANGVVFDVDLESFSTHLAGLVAESLRTGGTKIGPSEKSLQVEVVLLDFMFQGPCYLDYNVHLGNGQSFGQQTTGDSSNFTGACRKALEGAVPLILQDTRTARYLGGR
jgi:hypothetical protein